MERDKQIRKALWLQRGMKLYAMFQKNLPARKNS